MATSAGYERIAVFAFGVVFVVAMLVLAIAFPEPTAFQYTVFRIVLALAASGVAAFIPGFLKVDVGNWVRAGGAIAVFVIIYFFSPAKLVTEPRVRPAGASEQKHTVLNNSLLFNPFSGEKYESKGIVSGSPIGG